MEMQPQQEPQQPHSLRETQMGLGAPLTQDALAKMGLKEEGAFDDVEFGLENLDKGPKEIAEARRTAELERVQKERTRLETADAIDQTFGEIFLQSLIRLKTEQHNADVPAQTLYMQAAEIAAPVALAEAKQRDPNLPEALIHDEMMKAYTGTLQRIGALQPDHDLSAEDIQTIQRILKTEQIGISSEEGASAPEGPSIEGKRFASSGGKSEAAFEEADQTKGEDRSEGGPSMFRLSDMQ